MLGAAGRQDPGASVNPELVDLYIAERRRELVERLRKQSGEEASADVYRILARVAIEEHERKKGNAMAREHRGEFKKSGERIAEAKI